MNENENTVFYNNKRERERERKRKMSIPYISVLVNACVNTRNIIIINYYYMEGQEIYERKKKNLNETQINKFVVRVVCGRGVSSSNVLFAQHSGGIAKRREDQQQQHNEILEKKGHEEKDNCLHFAQYITQSRLFI